MAKANVTRILTFTHHLVYPLLLFGSASTLCMYVFNFPIRTDSWSKIHSSLNGIFKDATNRLSRYTVSNNALGQQNTNCSTNGACDLPDQKAIFDSERLYQAVETIHTSLYSRSKNETCVQRFPSCIIIGVKKSGTRELIDFMAMHPHIVIKRKQTYELNYFKHPVQSLDWYRKQMPCSYSDQITVTKSPFYFSDPNVPERLYKYNATLKMIILVREPITRALSGLSFKFQNQLKQKGLSFNESLSPVADDVLVNKVTGRANEHHEEIRLSTYDTAMMRYLKYFSKDQLLIIETGEFKTNPAKVLNRIETFLGLEHDITDTMFAYNSKKQFYCVKRRSPYDDMACYGETRGRVKQRPIRQSTARILQQYFNVHNEEFFKIINMRYDW